MNQQIIEDISSFYHLDILSMTPIEGGWLNEKYKLSCRQGDYLLKIFSTKRYSQEGLRKIERAASIQMQFQDRLACTKILKTPVRHLENNIHYQIMQYVQGVHRQTNTISMDELYSLGKECAKMHQLLMTIPLDKPIDTTAFYHNLWNYHHQLKGIIDDALYTQQHQILKSFTPAFFNQLTQGYCHEDMAFDNILYHQNKVAAILDFDRCQPSFYLHDIGRIILSNCFNGEALLKDYIDTFLSGYTQILPLNHQDIINALKITWCIETQWWINENYLKNTASKPTQFRNELIWLTEHFFEL